ncbi:MAG: hypothetical protein ACRERX_05790 [Pseudomonas sp.]
MKTIVRLLTLPLSAPAPSITRAAHAARPAEALSLFPLTMTSIDRVDIDTERNLGFGLPHYQAGMNLAGTRPYADPRR